MTLARTLPAAAERGTSGDTAHSQTIAALVKSPLRMTDMRGTHTFADMDRRRELDASLTNHYGEEDIVPHRADFLLDPAGQGRKFVGDVLGKS